MTIPEPLRVVIVDDEAPARMILREACSRHADVELVAECAHGVEALDVIDEKKPDALFLDVQMPRLTGFEMLELLEHTPLVVFVTAYDEHALAAFDVHACDYLLKPFGNDRFDEALARIRERRASTQPSPSYAELSDDARAASLQRIAVRRGSDVDIIPVTNLEYLEARDDYVRLHAGDRSWLKQRTLAWFEKNLDSRRFVRVHRSFMLALDALASVESETKDRHVAVLKSGARVAISRAGMKRLRAHLE